MLYDDESIQEIKDVCEGKSSINRASVKLGLSKRTIQRKVADYGERGDSSFIHGNTNREPANKIPFDIIVKTIDDNDLRGCNFSELSRLLFEYKGTHVSATTLRNRFYQLGVLSSKCNKKTRKRLRKELLKQQTITALSLEESQTLSHLEQEELCGIFIHPTKPRSCMFGERLEMDASSHKWIRGLGKLTLHVCIDDASGFLLGLWLEKEETLHGYYQVMEQLLRCYGIPSKIRTDKRTVFIYNKKGKAKHENDSMTQFAYSCSKLGVELECHSDPNFKPKVERSNQTLQGMIPYRLHMEGITTIDDANAYLSEIFIPYFNKKFGYMHDMVNGKEVKIPSTFIDCTEEDIYTRLAVLSERVINKGATISYNNAYMALIDDTGRKVALPSKTKVTVAKLLDGALYATSPKGTCYVLETVPNRYERSPDFDIDVTPKPKVERQRVPSSHPWSYEKQMLFMEKDRLMQSLEQYYTSKDERRYG
jgi:hypothetical protein